MTLTHDNRHKLPAFSFSMLLQHRSDRLHPSKNRRIVGKSHRSMSRLCEYPTDQIQKIPLLPAIRRSSDRHRS
jgi:hypothetical protein